jgi:hypothetical protein
MIRVPIRNNMLSSSLINCRSIDSLTCTRAAGTPTAAAARLGRYLGERWSSSTTSGTTRSLPWRHAPPGRPTPLVPWIISCDDHEVANDHVGDVMSEQDDDVEAFSVPVAPPHTRRGTRHMPVLYRLSQWPRLHNLPIVLRTRATS